MSNYWPIRGLCLFAWVCAGGLCCEGFFPKDLAIPHPLRIQSARAQPFVFPTLSNSDESTKDRDQLYRELAEDVLALERELGIYKRVIKLVSPSVVHIEATPLLKYSSQQDLEEAGSGILIQLPAIPKKIYVLTNRHVVRHSDKDHLRLEVADGQQLTTTKIWTDAKTDVAILAVEGNGLIPARIGDSNQSEMGDIVFAFGSPFNLQNSVSRGIISAKGRSNLDLGDGDIRYQNFMQTDAAINPGNSGGPLVNLRGEVIGLNTAIASNSGGNDGIGFSIPINIAIQITNQLVTTGHIRRGFLGVSLDGTFDNQKARHFGLPRSMGTRVLKVRESSPAAFANLQVDDIILRYDGNPINDDHHLVSLVNLTKIGKRVKLLVLREGKLLARFAEIGTNSNVAK